MNKAEQADGEKEKKNTRYAKSLYSGIAKKMTIIQGYHKTTPPCIHAMTLDCTALHCTAPVRPYLASPRVAQKCQNPL